MGFEPMNPLSQVKRLAGARTRPLCDPSLLAYMLSNGLNPSNTIFRATLQPAVPQACETQEAQEIAELQVGKPLKRRSAGHSLRMTVIKADECSILHRFEEELNVNQSTRANS